MSIYDDKGMPEEMKIPEDDGLVHFYPEGRHFFRITGGGLTKREYFAAIAMQGILSGVAGRSERKTEWLSRAVECADALISELNK